MENDQLSPASAAAAAAISSTSDGGVQHDAFVAGFPTLQHYTQVCSFHVYPTYLERPPTARRCTLR